MTVLGFHLVTSLIAALVLQKFLAIFPLTRWLLADLLLWVVPSHSYLTEYVELAHSKSNGNGNSNKARTVRKTAGEKKPPATSSATAEKEIAFPKDLAVPLLPGKIKARDVQMLLYYGDLHWVLHISALTAVVFLVSELFQLLFPLAWYADVNLTILWLALVLCCALKMLVMLTWLVVSTYSENTADRTIISLAGLCFFLVAVAVLMMDGTWLDLQVDEGLTALLEPAPDSGKVRRRSSSLVLLIKTGLALSAACLSSTLVFPGLRQARSYLGGLRHSGIVEKVFFQISFIYPLLLVLLWVRPVAGDVLFPAVGPALLPWLSVAAFEHARLALVVPFCALRFAMSRAHLQQYLHSAQQRVDAHRRLVVRYTSTQLTNTIRTVNGSLAVVALQYLCPVITLLTSVVLLHSLGDFSWTGEFLSSPEAPAGMDPARIFFRLPAVLASIFPPLFFKGVLTFYVVWLLLSCAASTCVGFVYANFSGR